MNSENCRACGAKLTGRFCSQCGAPVDGAPVSPRHHRAVWAAAAFAILTVVALVVIAVRQPQTQPAELQTADATPGSADGTPPDISGLSLRQQFDTLYHVVMRASEAGDGARAARFLPMALMAYNQLDAVDADTRYHAAVLRLHVEGDIKPALLLADSIQATLPHHLFAFMIRGSAGQLAGDQTMIRKAAQDFLSAWDAEIASGRPEYRDHRSMLDQFRDRAVKTASNAKP
jgi:hypothetical protein